MVPVPPAAAREEYLTLPCVVIVIPAADSAVTWPVVGTHVTEHRSIDSTERFTFTNRKKIVVVPVTSTVDERLTAQLGGAVEPPLKSGFTSSSLWSQPAYIFRARRPQYSSLIDVVPVCKCTNDEKGQND